MNSARQIVSSLFVALLLASLLNAASLVASAERLELGPGRSLALEVVSAVERLSEGLGLDHPRRIGKQLLAGQLLSFGQQVGVREAAPPPPSPEASLPDEGDPTALETGSEVLEGTREDPSLSTVVLESTPCSPVGAAAAGTQTAPARALEVWYIGDSLLQYIQPSLRTELLQPGFFSNHFDWHYSTGLSRPDYFDWPGRMRERLQAGSPDVIVVMFGGNDGQALASDQGPLRVGTEEWRAEYTRRVEQFGEVLSMTGSRVYWIGLPIMRSTTMRKRAGVMNAAYESAADRSPSIRFVETWSLFSDAEGHYTKYLTDADGQLRVGRVGDGIHLSRAGTRKLVRELVGVFDEEWDLASGRRRGQDPPCGTLH